MTVICSKCSYLKARELVGILNAGEFPTIYEDRKIEWRIPSDESRAILISRRYALDLTLHGS